MTAATAQSGIYVNLTTFIYIPTIYHLIFLLFSIVISHDFFPIPGPVQPVGLESVESALVFYLRSNFRIDLFNPTPGLKTSVASSSLQGNVKTAYNHKCAVCETDQNITNAHILRHRSQVEQLWLQWDSSNFIALCGTEGEAGTCHSLFDSYQMSFIHLRSIQSWVVVGGPRSGTRVQLNTNPHKAALHAHFAKCVLLKSLTPNVSIDASDLDTSG